uniref:ARAD1D48620p n=1 Tax=Blastobotrys adeninivorans TaxID=409370 RepID=A0A060TIQ9_BLAAD
MPKVIVIGSGIIGLTAAYYIKKAEPSLRVSIVARDMPKHPCDPGDAWIQGEWASPYGGAIFCPSFNPTEQVKAIERETYRHYWEIAHRDPGAGVEFCPMRSYYDQSVVTDPDNELFGHDFMHDYRRIPKEELPPGVTGGIEALGFVVNPRVYLPWLRAQLEDMGVKFVRGDLTSIGQVVKKFWPAVMVNATGLGSSYIRGVRDGAVVPVRGQVAIARLENYPQSKGYYIRHGYEFTYVIPKPLSDNLVTLGGVSQEGSTLKEVDKETHDSIISRSANLVPSAQIDSSKVIDDVVAFRPGRYGGYRLELSRRGIPIVHAYGFEGNGYIMSGGVGKVIVSHVQRTLGLKQTRPKEAKL